MGVQGGREHERWVFRAWKREPRRPRLFNLPDPSPLPLFSLFLSPFLQERFRTLTSSYYRGAQAIIFGER